MIQSFSYDPAKDIQAVPQYGFIDLAKCFSQGFVPTSVDIGDELYNGLDEPSAVGAQPVDVFEAIRASHAVSGSSSSSEPVSPVEP